MQSYYEGKTILKHTLGVDRLSEHRYQSHIPHNLEYVARYSNTNTYHPFCSYLPINRIYHAKCRVPYRTKPYTGLSEKRCVHTLRNNIFYEFPLTQLLFPYNCSPGSTTNNPYTVPSCLQIRPHCICTIVLSANSYPLPHSLLRLHINSLLESIQN